MTTLGHIIDAIRIGGWTLLALGILGLGIVVGAYTEGRDARHRMERSAAAGYRTLLTDWRTLAARTSGRRARPSTITRLHDRGRRGLTRLRRHDPLEAFLAQRSQERIGATR